MEFQGLDAPGLNAFWQQAFIKIKAQIDSSIPKIDSTLTKENGILSVTTPVHGVISQKDFDALPPEEQSKGVYFIQM